MSLVKISKLLKKTFALTKKCKGLLKANLKAQKAFASPKKSIMAGAPSSVLSSPSRKKKMIHDKGACSECGKTVSLTKDGFIHKAHSCAGGGKLPKGGAVEAAEVDEEIVDSDDEEEDEADSDDEDEDDEKSSVDSETEL